MTTVAISSKFQIVIPKAVRKTLDLSSGMKVEVVTYGHRIELIPLMPIKELKGSLKGINTTVIREKDRI
ncbi:MAG: AbrB/MazE/SpoVT family DNA-binding domain-containing protein [Patescibacteria group bacterium]